MPRIESTFHPPWYLSSRHVQTVAPVLISAGPLPDFRRERLELSDGDFLDLDWLETGADRVAILCSGLEGNSRDPGMLRLAKTFARSGWDVLSWNYRGCSGEPNRLPRSYHSGATEDLRAVIARAGSRAAVLVGCSLGGNLLLKYLGESQPAKTIRGAAAISPPIDLASTARALDHHAANRIYRRRLISSLARKVRAKAAVMPDAPSVEGLKNLHGFADFDDRYTSRIHGFDGAEDYWRRCSARQFLQGIRIAVLILSAQDDPFLTPSCYPVEEAESLPHLMLETPRHGGHLGFVENLRPEDNWAARRVCEFVSALA